MLRIPKNTCPRKHSKPHLDSEAFFLPANLGLKRRQSNTFSETWTAVEFKGSASLAAGAQVHQVRGEDQVRSMKLSSYALPLPRTPSYYLRCDCSSPHVPKVTIADPKKGRAVALFDADVQTVRDMESPYHFEILY